MKSLRNRSCLLQLHTTYVNTGQYNIMRINQIITYMYEEKLICIIDNGGERKKIKNNTN